MVKRTIEKYEDHIMGVGIFAPFGAIILAMVWVMFLFPLCLVLGADLSIKQAVYIASIFALSGAILGAIIGATATALDKKNGNPLSW